MANESENATGTVYYTYFNGTICLAERDGTIPEEDGAYVASIEFAEGDTYEAHAVKDMLHRANTQPDLLEACKGLRAMVHDFVTHAAQADCADLIAAADAAIRKAEGGAA